jgi:hypothetical protein
MKYTSWRDRKFGTNYPRGKVRMKLLLIVVVCLQGCATAFAVADVAGATVVYAGKTVVNTIDAVTPDIVNKKK